MYTEPQKLIKKYKLMAPYLVIPKIAAFGRGCVKRHFQHIISISGIAVRDKRVY
jgi:hypothetical protein